MSDRIAVSSWALHRTLGTSYPDSPGGGKQEPRRHAEPGLDLMRLPSELAQRGYSAMQLCHFHLPSTDAATVRGFRSALAEAGVKLHALLIDEGDLAHPEHSGRDEAWIAGWLKVANDLGAERARIITGKQPFDAQTMARSVAALDRLASQAGNVRIETENWHETMRTPEAVNAVLDALEGRVGLCCDWGNWPRPQKYDDLPRIFPRAETCHAKLDFLDDGTLDRGDADTMLAMAQTHGFAGTYVIVNGGPAEGTEWDALDAQRAKLREA